jgi:hypothetical protein
LFLGESVLMPVQGSEDDQLTSSVAIRPVRAGRYEPLKRAMAMATTHRTRPAAAEESSLAPSVCCLLSLFLVPETEKGLTATCAIGSHTHDKSLTAARHKGPRVRKEEKEKTRVAGGTRGLARSQCLEKGNDGLNCLDLSARPKAYGIQECCCTGKGDQGRTGGSTHVHIGRVIRHSRIRAP